MRKRHVLDTRDMIVRQMQSGHYTPLQGWMHLKETWTQLNASERITDKCRSEIGLSDNDEQGFFGDLPF